MNIYPYYLLGAEAYGAGNYDCGEFEEGCAAQTTATPTGTDVNAGGSLVNTGYNVIIPVALGAALIIAAVALIVTKFVRKRKSSASA